MKTVIRIIESDGKFYAKGIKWGATVRKGPFKTLNTALDGCKDKEVKSSKSK